MVSAGNTGAMLAACLFELRRLPGVDRPAIAVVIPSRSGPSVLLDAGANADARAGAPAPVRRRWARSSPRRSSRSRARRCACSRSARSPRRATSSTLEAHALLAASELNFPATSRAATCWTAPPTSSSPTASPATSSLKLLEGTIKTVLDALREEIAAAARGKVGGLLIRPAARGLRDRLDPETYGGAYLLGLRGLAVIAHGNSSRRAIANAIRLAARGVEHDVVGGSRSGCGTSVSIRALSEPPARK